MDLRTVIFDLDDTLVVKSQDRQALFDEVARITDTPPLDGVSYENAYYEVDPAETREPIFEAIVDDSSVSTAEIAAAYRDAVNDSLAPVDDVEELLVELSEHMGYALGVLTDGPSISQRSKLDHLGWTDYFDEIVVSGDLGTHKPDPVTFETILRSLGEPAKASVYVGDKPDADISGAAAVGMTTIQVCYEGGPDVDPDADAAVQRSALTAELPAALRKLSER
jgi:putative hydrolase of the HAD superfamily